VLSSVICNDVLTVTISNLLITVNKPCKIIYVNGSGILCLCWNIVKGFFF
jgi:hypothetical protein